MTAFRVGISKVGGTDTVGGLLQFTYYLDLIASLTPAGSIVKDGIKIFSGDISPSGIIERAPSIILEGTLISDGIISRAISKILSGSITPSGLLTPNIQAGFLRMSLAILEKIVPTLEITEKIIGVIHISVGDIEIDINGG